MNQPIKLRRDYKDFDEYLRFQITPVHQEEVWSANLERLEKEIHFIPNPKLPQSILQRK